MFAMCDPQVRETIVKKTTIFKILKIVKEAEQPKTL